MSRTRVASSLLLVAAVALASSAEAQNRRVRLLVNGLYNSTSQSFTDSVTFTSFLENATSTRSYDRGTGFAFEVGAIVGLASSFGVMGSFELFDGTIDGSFQESLPHPLFFDQPRSLAGELGDLSYTERALHIDAVFTREISSMTVDVFGGPTLFFTQTEVISTVSSSSDYPFDEVQLVSTNTVKLDDNPIGFNVGGSLTYRITPAIGVAFQARYSQASVSVTPPDGNAIELDAGGFRVGGGIRIAF